MKFLDAMKDCRASSLNKNGARNMYIQLDWAQKIGSACSIF